MGFFDGPIIVTSGSVLLLDAADRNSYSGSGTAWTDLTLNNNNGTLTNGPTFNSANQGNILFDGTNDYVEVATNFGSAVSTYTISFWARRSVENRMPISSRVVNSPNPGANGTTFYWFGDNSWSWTHSALFPNSEYYYPKSVSIPLNAWGYFAAVYNGSTMSIYRQGVFEGSTSTSGTADFSSGWRIGSWTFNSSFSYAGNIAIVLNYNRALSATEILQNYNATKSRFGL